MIYVDSGIIIRMLEGNEQVRVPIEEHLDALSAADRILVTSRISTLECRCKPLREGKPDLIALYDRFFHAGEVLVQEIDAPVIDKATELRAFVGLRTPDAIHAATALLLSVKSFWTADSGFSRCPSLPVVIFPAV
jgi:uncharacterized protein